MAIKGFSQKWKDFPDYIIGITNEIWESRGIATLHNYYAPDIPVRSPMGIQQGNQAVMASTMATCHEFPDRQLYGEDVIWSGDPDTGFLSYHRIITKATHSRDDDTVQLHVGLTSRSRCTRWLGRPYRFFRLGHRG